MAWLMKYVQICWIGCCAVAMLGATRLLTREAVPVGWLDVFVFSATVFGYYFNTPARNRQWFVWSLGLPAFFSYFQLDFTVKLAALLPALILASYYGWQRPGNAGLRRLLLVKPHAIAFAWSWVTVVLPLVPAHWDQAAFLFAGRAGFIFALALAYDLHDRAFDLEHGLATLANQQNLVQTMRMFDGALAVAAVFAGLDYYIAGVSFAATCARWVSLAASAVLVRYFLKNARLEPWRKMLIDGLMVLQWALIALATYFALD